MTPTLAQDEKTPVPATYANTPDTMLPFRDFREPYYRFFETVTEFLGTGRDKELSELPASVKLGFFAPAGSAPDADLGEEMLEGVTLALEQANTAGGYQGIPFEFVRRVDAGLWGSSSNEMIGFRYEDDVHAVIGSIDGANTHIALRVALKIQMPMVNTATTDPTLTETRVPWLLRCMADDRQQGYALAHHIISEQGLKTVMAIRVNDRFGRMGIGEFRDAARRLKRPLRAELRFNRGDRDFTVQLDRAAKLKPDAIVIWANAADAAALVKAIHGRGWTNPDHAHPVRLFGCDRLVSERFIADVGRAGENVVAVASFDPTRDDPSLRAFQAAFQERFDHPPGVFAAHAYDGANILFDAVRAAGLNRARIRDALAGAKRYEGVTGSIRFDATHNDIGPVYIATLRQGRFVYEHAGFVKLSAAEERQPYYTMRQSPPQARVPASENPPHQDVVRIGCFMPLDDRGRDAVAGLKMALEEDAANRSNAPRVELLVRDARAAWGGESAAIVDLVTSQQVVAIIGSTERRGTHLVETLAAKLHFPVISLCGDDPTINQIPLAWIFSLASDNLTITGDFAARYHRRHGREATESAALGYDAGRLLLEAIGTGKTTRTALRDALAADFTREGVTGPISFDELGNRVSRAHEPEKGVAVVIVP